VSAFADIQITFGTPTGALPTRRTANGWRASGEMSGVWSAALAADPASTLVQTRDVAPWSVWLIGELLRYDSLSAPADPLGAFVLDLRKGKENAAALDGHFALFAWNSELRQWHIWTDRFGTVHCYAGLGARRSALGTYHPAVSRAVGAKKLDWQGLAGFFTMGFFPEDRTHFEEVKILRPAMHYVFSERGEEKRAGRYWEWAHTPEKAPSFAGALDQFGDTLGTVLREQSARGRVAVPVSGGLDSRTTVAMLLRQQERLWYYSYGYGSDSVETRIARQVAAARGAHCDTFEIGEYLFDRMDDVLSASEGFNDVTQTRQVGVSAQLAAHADVVIAAHWGDVWLDSAEAAANGSAAFAKVAKQGRQWLLEHLCAPRAGGDPEKGVKEAVQRELDRVSHIADADFRMKAFKTDTWSFRWTVAGVRAFNLGATPRLPFYDTRMADLFCTLPAEYLRGRRLQVEWLKGSAPDLARITWQARDANLFMYPYAGTLLLPKRAVRKAWRVITRTKVIERNWEVQFLSPTGRARLGDALLRPRLKLHEFVAPGAVQQLLDRFFAQPLEDKRGYTVSMLLTFSEWLERFA
jgi:hypothetical protein